MSVFSRIWNRWKVIAHKIGNFQARLILILFYFLILAPFALIIKKLDPLGMRKNTTHGWQQRPADSVPPLEKAVRQW
jgi:hypothetical protein